MLAVVLLLVAASALANPIVRVDLISERDTPSDSIIEAILELDDDSKNNIYILTSKEIIRNLASSNDPRSQALSFGQAIALMESLAPGTPGDACAAAQFIDSSVNGVGDGQALGIFINSLASQIDLVAQLSENPEALRYATGPRGNCNGGGRSYQFEAAWDLIFAAATRSQFNLINEQYGAVKRLYSTYNVRSNNVAAFITAVSLPVVNDIILNALGEITDFLGALRQGNVGAYASAAKQALLRAASSYNTS